MLTVTGGDFKKDFTDRLTIWKSDCVLIRHRRSNLNVPATCASVSGERYSMLHCISRPTCEFHHDYVYRILWQLERGRIEVERLYLILGSLPFKLALK